MAKIKLTKSAVDAAQPQDKAIELRDTVVPGFLCKITPAGRKVFMLQYRTNAGERRKPALGQYGELTVDQARTMAQEWLAEVRRGGRPRRGQERRPQGTDHEGVLPHLHGGLFQTAQQAQHAARLSGRD
ncbi:Arm DNA-binding domain-containing protein [Stenotrophomonas maltophilia]